MEQILDNPTYYAMMSGNVNLSLGTSAVRYFPAAVSPDEIVIPGGWKVNYHGVGLQMVGEKAHGRVLGGWEFVPLRLQHVPLMVELAKLTNPGPFGERTIEFGGFVGVFDGERLMAMSGHRLHPSPYVEVSGVCTHPDYVGRGLGGALTYFQVERD